MKRGCVADMAPLEPARRAIPPTGTKRLVQDTNSGAIYRDIVYFFPYLCILKLRKRSKLLRMNNDLLVEYVLGYELAIYKVFWSSAFCITSNNSFCIAKVLIFSHFTKNSQIKFPFRLHFR